MQTCGGCAQINNINNKLVQLIKVVWYSVAEKAEVQIKILAEIGAAAPVS